MTSEADLLADLSLLAPSDFAREAYDRILGRPPTPLERDRMVSALLAGETPSRLLGALRYGDEGRARATDVRGLRPRYVAQRLFDLPVAGAVLQWINAVVRLPSSLKYFRALRELDAERHAQLHRDALMQIDTLRTQLHEGALRIEETRAQLHEGALRIDETRVSLGAVHAEMQRRLDQMTEWLRALAGRVDAAATRSELAAACTQLQLDVAAMRSELAATALQMERIGDDTRSLGHRVGEVDTRVKQADARVAGILPPPLADTLEVPGEPIVDVARQRAGVSPETPLAALDGSTRYAMFESVFYESAAVAEKQRVYLRYLDAQSRALPFLDLGCGRGEFLRILAGAGFRAIGVDVNPVSFPALRGEGFAVVEDDVLAFLERDTGRYAGISLLQVAEHLTREQIDRLLALAVPRIAPGGIFILETPNPLSPLALSVFHTDATHVAPLPPEAMRYAIEAAGFEQTRTLFQGRIPGDPFAGPDPRAYYVDYAIIATRGSGP